MTNTSTPHSDATPDPHLGAAMAADLDAAVRATRDAAAGEAFTRAQDLLGGRPPSDPVEAETWNVAAQVLAFRIEHAAGLDALGAVVGLRRWGVTWETIGEAAGISRQAAHARWGGRVRAVLDRYGTGDLGGPVADDESDLDH